MPHSNKQTLLDANAAILKNDHEGFLAHCTEDTEWTFPGDTTLKGKQAVREWMSANYTEAPRFEVERLIGEGDHVAAIGSIVTKDAEGRDTDSAYCDVWRFRDGKLAALTAYVVAA